MLNVAKRKAKAPSGLIDPSLPVVFVADCPTKLIEALYAFSDGMPRRADGQAAYTLSLATIEDVGSGETFLAATLTPRGEG